jgi:hypothetical protein
MTGALVIHQVESLTKWPRERPPRRKGLDAVRQDRLGELNTLTGLIDSWQGRINLDPHLLRNRGAAVADDHIQERSLSVIRAYVGPDIRLSGLDSQLTLDLCLLLGSTGSPRSFLRRPPTEVQRCQGDQRCGYRYSCLTTHLGTVPTNRPGRWPSR